MKLDQVSVNETLNKAREAIEKEKDLSPSIRAIIEILILLVQAFVGRVSKNSRNSSQPPSQDKNRERGSKNGKSTKKPGGQNGHDGYRLEKTDNPDVIENISIDRCTLPKGKYHDIGFEARQVIDFKISKIVTEYRAQVLEDKKGNQFIAPFPDFVKSDVQYGYRTKSHSVYLSQYQLLPYVRIQSYFFEKMTMSLSTGSIFNFNKEAYLLLEKFESIAISQLIKSAVLNADETGINVNKKTIWLHSASNARWSYFYPHEKRGTEAMDAMGVLPHFTGILIHDHWKPYYTYDQCDHSLCNAHHIRELEYAATQDKQAWAGNMQSLLCEINDAVNATEIKILSTEVCKSYEEKYDAILLSGESECPLPISTESNTAGQTKRRGRIKKSKSRNLLERLRNFKDDTLRFMKNSLVPFTNNSGENDLRMTKVQQKISGCFRSMEGAYIFCRIRSYLLTCQKHDLKMTDALELLFQGKMPKFIIDLLSG